MVVGDFEFRFKPRRDLHATRLSEANLKPTADLKLGLGFIFGFWVETHTRLDRCADEDKRIRFLRGHSFRLSTAVFEARCGDQRSGGTFNTRI